LEHAFDGQGHIVGLHLSLPTRAVVLCVDQKSQIQVLDRTQPLLIAIGRLETDSRTKTHLAMRIAQGHPKLEALD